MSGTDFLAEATAELYGSDLEGFTERRAALAARARAAGDRPAARDIAGLRKPTRPAWMINQLVRADPGIADRLAGLGDELRAAAAALDGARIRELSRDRRQLIDTLIQQALRQAGEQSPPAGLREDLTATFGAALADPGVARDVAAGTLLRAVHRADFSAGMPGLTLVPPPAAAGTRAPRKAAAAGEPAAARTARAARKASQAQAAGRTPAAQDVRAGPAGTGKAAQAARDAKAAELARAAEQARAAREAREARAARAAEERRRAIAEAEQVLAEASRAAGQAAQDERDGRNQVAALEAQLDEARRQLTGARRRVRETQAARQKAQRALSRLPGQARDTNDP